MSDLPIFTLADVSCHNNSSSCWIIIEGNVYDVGRFLDEHPGGEEVILELAGMDATEGFDQIGHSDDARDLLKKMCIGRLDPTAASIPPPAAIDSKETRTENSSVNGIINT